MLPPPWFTMDYLLKICPRSSTLVSSDCNTSSHMVWGDIGGLRCFWFFFIRTGFHPNYSTSPLKHVKNTTDCYHVWGVTSTFPDVLAALQRWSLGSFQEKFSSFPFVGFWGTAFTVLHGTWNMFWRFFWRPFLMFHNEIQYMLCQLCQHTLYKNISRGKLNMNEDIATTRRWEDEEWRNLCIIGRKPSTWHLLQNNDHSGLNNIIFTAPYCFICAVYCHFD